jgi:3'-5' exoribonuclease
VEGQLIGHIAIAMRMISDKLRGLPGFPPELRNLVEHMLLSHHGKLEFGSPKIPLFPEALLLHYLDDMDSKMECMRALIEKDPQSEGYFTTWSQSLERVALRKSRYLTGPEGGPAPAVARTEPVPEPVLVATPLVSTPLVSTPLVSTPPPQGRDFPAAQPKPQPAPANGSLFGSKLLQALNDERN